MTKPPTDQELLDECYKCSHAAADITEQIIRGKLKAIAGLDHLLELSRQLACATQTLHNRTCGEKPKPMTA